jgi:hypothetical protein
MARLRRVPPQDRVEDRRRRGTLGIQARQLHRATSRRVREFDGFDVTRGTACAAHAHQKLRASPWRQIARAKLCTRSRRYYAIVFLRSRQPSIIKPDSTINPRVPGSGTAGARSDRAAMASLERIRVSSGNEDAWPRGIHGENRRGKVNLSVLRERGICLQRSGRENVSPADRGIRGGTQISADGARGDVGHPLLAQDREGIQT